MDKETFWHAVQDVDTTEENQYREFELMLFSVFRRKMTLRMGVDPATFEPSVNIYDEDGGLFRARFDMEVIREVAEESDSVKTSYNDSDIYKRVISCIAAELADKFLGTDNAENSN